MSDHRPKFEKSAAPSSGTIAALTTVAAVSTEQSNDSSLRSTCLITVPHDLGRAQRD